MKDRWMALERNMHGLQSFIKILWYTNTQSPLLIYSDYAAILFVPIQQGELKIEMRQIAGVGLE